MFEVRDLSMTYGRSFLRYAGEERRPVLRDLCFELRPGERVGLLGVNGAGKTTLLKLMLGILKPTGGTVRFEGHDSRNYPGEVKALLSVIFAQKSQLWWNIPVDDSLRIIALMYGATEEEAGSRIDRLRHELALGELVGTAPRFMSFGQRMRCEVAAALVSEPAFLILDEAFIGLDPAYKQGLHSYLRKRSLERNMALLFASHDLEYLEGLVDRVLILDGARLVLDTCIEKLDAEKTRRTRVRIDFGRAPAPSEVVRLNTLTAVFPDASWDFDSRERGLVRLEVPSRFTDQVDFIYAFLRENVRGAGVEFKEKVSLRDILDGLKNRDPGHRRERLEEILRAAEAATESIETMLQLSRLRQFTAPDEVNERVFPYVAALWRERRDPHLRSFLLSLFPALSPLLTPQGRERMLELLLEALSDPDERIAATAVEMAGGVVALGRIGPGPDASNGPLNLQLLVRERILAALDSSSRRCRANAFVALIRQERGAPQLDLLERLVGDPELTGSFLHVFEVLSQAAPFAPEQPVPEGLRPRVESVIRRLLNLWMEQRCRLSARSISRLLGFLQAGSRET